MFNKLNKIIEKRRIINNLKVVDPLIKTNTEFLEIYEVCKPFTMTSIERMFALYLSIKYVLKSNIQGDFVECGVWKGGSAMIMALTLQKSGAHKKIYLYDTFSGMPQPSKEDTLVSNSSVFALDTWLKKSKESCSLEL